jgi:hypothetical protein
MHGYDTYDYGARGYYPAMGRFTSVDPLAEMDYSISPYAYCKGNSVNSIDPTGMMGEASSYVDPLGTVIKHVDDNDPKVYLVNDENAWKRNGESNANLPVVGFENPSITYKKGDHYTQYFGIGQGILNPLSNDPLLQFEMWLDSDPESFEDFLLKSGTDIAYSLVNSPYSVFMGQTIGGTPLTSSEKIDAFIDFAPGLISDGLGQTKTVTKVKQIGLKGYNKFEKSLSKDLRKGKGWQKRVSALFHNNKLLQKALNDFENARKAIGIIETSKKHSTNK